MRAGPVPHADRLSSCFADGLVLIMSSRGGEQRQETSCCVSSSEGTGPIPEGCTLMTSPPATVTLGVKMSTYECGGTAQKSCFLSPEVPAKSTDSGFLPQNSGVRISGTEAQGFVVLVNPQVVPGIGAT